MRKFIWAIIDLIFVAVFNLFFFVLSDDISAYNASAWLSYALIHFAYLTVVLTPVICGNSKNSYIYKLTTTPISTLYFLVEFVVGLAFVFINPESITAALLIQVLIFAIYLAAVLFMAFANRSTSENQARQQEEVSYIKNAAVKVKILMGKMTDSKANKAIESAYDAVHSCPTRSIPQVASVERDINEVIELLSDAVRKNAVNDVITLSQKIVDLTVERNAILRANQ